MKNCLDTFHQIITTSTDIEQAIDSLAAHVSTIDNLTIESAPIDELMQKLSSRYPDYILSAMQAESEWKQTLSDLSDQEISDETFLKHMLVQRMIMPAIYKAVNQQQDARLRTLTLDNLDLVEPYAQPQLLLTETSTLTKLELSGSASEDDIYMTFAQLLAYAPDVNSRLTHLELQIGKIPEIDITDNIGLQALNDIKNAAQQVITHSRLSHLVMGIGSEIIEASAVSSNSSVVTMDISAEPVTSETNVSSVVYGRAASPTIFSHVLEVCSLHETALDSRPVSTCS